MEERSSSSTGERKDASKQRKSSSDAKVKSSTRSHNKDGKDHHTGVSTRQSTSSTVPAATTGTDRTTVIDLEGNEPIPGPSGLNSNSNSKDDHSNLLEELDALFSQRLSEYMNYEPVGPTGDDYEEFEDIIPPAQPASSSKPSNSQEISFDLDEAISQVNKSTGATSGLSVDPPVTTTLPLALADQYFNELQVEARRGEAAPESIAKITNYSFRNKLADEVREAKLKRFEVPSNCEGLDLVKVNQVIWNKMLPTTRGMDSKMQTTQSFLVAAGAGVSNIVSRFMSMAPSDFTPEIIKSMTTDMLTTQVLIGQTNVELNHRRRELIRPDLNSSYSHLCSSSQPFSSFLFGDEFNDAVKEISDANKVCEQIFSRGGNRGRPTRPRGFRARGHRYQPYQYMGYGQDYPNYQYANVGRGQGSGGQPRGQFKRPFLAKGRAAPAKKGRKEHQ